jgi:AcrR family transcriptional regulator
MPVKGDGGHGEGRGPGRRTQPERRAATRAALIGAARDLFATKGFAGAGREEIVERAGVTRGAMYHHFSSKEALFAAVYEEVEAEVVAHVAEAAMAVADPMAQLRLGSLAYLEVAADPGINRICLLDAPSVLPAEVRRDVSERHVVALVRHALDDCIAAGRIEPQPVGPLARVLLAALVEAATLVAQGADPDEVATVVERLLARL